ncbi:MAG TPA: hypothetical protein PK711_04085 [Bacteroidales bacterium]|nr:hypothetical protein [Bacteroidales bacterium]
MKKTGSLVLSGMALMIFAFSFCKQSNAIPAFARKYQFSCQVCHTPAMPRLKAFGDDFAGAGFRLTDVEAPRYFVPVGDDKLSLLREVPLALRFEGFLSYNYADGKTADFGVPWGLKLLSGGEISKKLSYYFYFFMGERGEVAGIEDAFIMYHDLFGSGVNISFGQFQACDPLYKRELRYTLEDYTIFTVRPGNSSISLKYERGLLFDYGLKTGTDFVLEVVNGNGIGPAGEGYLFDIDKYKNFLLKISQSAGKNVDLGFFGYYGKEALKDVTSMTSSMYMFGPNLTLDFNEKFILNVQYLYRNDSKVVVETDAIAVEEDVMTQGGFAELIYSPRGDRSDWYLTALFNWVDSDLDNLDYTSATLHAGYLLRRNIRLVGEYTQGFTGQEFGKASVGFVAAF